MGLSEPIEYPECRVPACSPISSGLRSQPGVCSRSPSNFVWLEPDPKILDDGAGPESLVSVPQPCGASELYKIFQLFSVFNRPNHFGGGAKNF